MSHDRDQQYIVLSTIKSLPRKVHCSQGIISPAKKLICLSSTCYLNSIVQHKNCNDSNEYLFDAQIRFSMYCAVNDYAVLKRVERAEVRHI